VDRHYEPLWAYVCSLTRGATEAEDLLHQAFLLAFDRLAAGEGFTGDAGAWLRGVLRNLVHAWWRARLRLPQDVADHLKRLADDADDALTVAATKELKAALAHCLGRLGPEERRLVAQRYEEGRRIESIAGEMRRSAVALRVQLFRIRQALKLCIETQLARGRAT
jgi:RNA polymerase sigma-70 factor (ECF subfamily)